jgi:prophage DNA circulation protein
MNSTRARRLEARSQNQQENQLEQVESLQVQRGIDSFNNIISVRDRLNRRVAKRLTFMTRFTMIALGALMVAFMLFMYIMSSKVAELATHIEGIQTNYTTVSGNIENMNYSIATVSTNVSHIKQITPNLKNIDKTTKILTANMAKLDHNLATLTTSLYGIQSSTKELDKSFGEMQFSVYQMGMDVREVSKPVRLFNNMMGR